MTTITATFTTKDQNWEDETTIYWFDVVIDGENEEYGIADTNGDRRVVDADGCPHYASESHVYSLLFDKMSALLTDEIVMAR